MYQLTYKLHKEDEFISQLSELGGQFLSKGPAFETYFSLEEHQLRLDQGMTAELVLITKHDHYQELIDASAPQYQQLKEILAKALGETRTFSKQLIRYQFKQTLIELHQYKTLGTILCIQAEDLQLAKTIARQFSLPDEDRLNKTSFDLSA